MIKSEATKIRIGKRHMAKMMFNRNTSEGRDAYHQAIQGRLLDYLKRKSRERVKDEREQMGY